MTENNRKFKREIKKKSKSFGFCNACALRQQVGPLGSGSLQNLWTLLLYTWLSIRASSLQRRGKNLLKSNQIVRKPNEPTSDNALT